MASQAYTSGSGQFQAPITGSYTIILIGGGGGGGGGNGSANNGGGGGGGGACCIKVVSLTQGQNYDYAVGGTGSSGAKNGQGGSGGASTFIVGGTTYSAGGGGGGQPASVWTGGTPGTASNGDTNNSGGTGVAGTTSYGGGGAGAAGTTGTGKTGTTSTAGVATSLYGGAGGNGSSVANGSGTSATDPYGGGGGGGTRNGTGGAGNSGYVLIEWTTPSSIAGVTNGTSDVSGTIQNASVGPSPIAGATNGTSSASADLNGTGEVAGQSSGISDNNVADLNGTGAIAAQSNGTSLVAGDLQDSATGPSPIAGTTNGTSSVAGTLTGKGVLSSYTLGAQQLADPSFDSPGAWGLDAGWSVSGGQAHCDGTQVTASMIKTGGIDISKFYVVWLTVVASTAEPIRTWRGSPQGYIYYGSGKPGRYRKVWVPSSYSLYNLSADYDPAWIGSVDDFEVYLATPNCGGTATVSGTLKGKGKLSGIGDELIVNGTFDDGSGWTDPSGGWSISGGKATYLNSVSAHLYRSANTVEGNKYRIWWDHECASFFDHGIFYYNGTLFSNLYPAPTTRWTNGSVKEIGIAASSQSTISFYGQNTSGAQFSIDNFSVKDCTESIAGQATVSGTLTGKGSLASLSGKEMVADGDFGSVSNWEENGGWTVTGGVADFDSPFGGYLRQSDAQMQYPLQAGVKYAIKFTLSDVRSFNIISYDGLTSILRMTGPVVAGVNRAFAYSAGGFSSGGVRMLSYQALAFTVDDLSFIALSGWATVNGTLKAKGSLAGNIVNLNVTEEELFTDDFEAYTESALAGQGSWITAYNTMAVVDNSGDNEVYPNTSADGCAVTYDSSLGDDQYSEAVIAVPSAYIGVAVRLSGSGASLNGYSFTVNGLGGRFLNKITNGVSLAIATINGDFLSNNDVLKLEVIGPFLRAYINDSLLTGFGTNGVVVDSSYSSGKIGVAGYGNTGTPRLDDWTGGELALTQVSGTLQAASDGAIAGQTNGTSSVAGVLRESKANAYFAWLDSEPDDTVKGILNQYIIDLIEAGVYSKADCLFLPTLDTGPNSLKNLARNDFHLTANASPKFTPFLGYNIEAGSNSLQIDYNTTTDPINTLETSFTFGGAWAEEFWQSRSYFYIDGYVRYIYPNRDGSDALTRYHNYPVINQIDGTYTRPGTNRYCARRTGTTYYNLAEDNESWESGTSSANVLDSAANLFLTRVYTIDDGKCITRYGVIASYLSDTEWDDYVTASETAIQALINYGGVLSVTTRGSSSASGTLSGKGKLTGLGADQIADNSFETGTPWTFDTAWSRVGERAYYDDTTAENDVSQIQGNMLAPVEVSTLYVLEFDIDIVSGDAYIYLLNSAGTTAYIPYPPRPYPDGRNRVVFKTGVTVAGGGIGFYGYFASDNPFYLDNIVLRKATGSIGVATVSGTLSGKGKLWNIAPPCLMNDGNTKGWNRARAGFIEKNGSDLIGKMVDISGGTNYLQQSTDANKPLWVTDSEGGYASFGSEDNIETPSNPTIAQPVMIYGVFKMNSWVNSRMVVTSMGSIYPRMTTTDTSPRISVYAGAWSLANDDFTVGAWHIMRLELNGANSRLIADNEAPTTGNPNTQNFGGYRIGGDGSTYLSLNALWKEIIVRQVDEASNDEEDILRYLAREYKNFVNAIDSIVPTTVSGTLQSTGSLAGVSNGVATVSGTLTGAGSLAGECRPGLLNKIVAYWPCDEESGIVGNDAVGSNDLSLTDVTVNQSGVINKAFYFNNSSSQAALTTPITAGKSEFTLSFWAFILGGVLNDINGAFSEEYAGYYQFTIAGDVWATRDTSTGTEGNRNNDVALSGIGIDSWHHIVLVYSVAGGFKRLYVDAGGTPLESTTSVDRLTIPRAGGQFGRAGGAPYFYGYLDEIGAWDRALTYAEIQALFNSGSGLAFQEFYVGASGTLQAAVDGAISGATNGTSAVSGSLKGTGSLSTITLGAEKLTDGGFDSDDTYWTEGSANWVISGGVAVYDGLVSSYIVQYPEDMVSILDINTPYKLVFDISNTAGNYIRFYTGAGTINLNITDNYSNGNHIVRFSTPASVGNGNLVIYPTTDLGGYFTIDNISIKAVIPICQGTATVSGTLGTAGNNQISGQTNGTSLASATLVGTGALAGVSNGTSLASGTTVSQNNPIEGVTNGTSDASATLQATGALQAVSNGTSDASADLNSVGSVAGISNGVSSAEGILVGTGALAGVSNGTSNAAGLMLTENQLIGAIHATSLASATLKGTGAISAQTNGISLVSGAITGKKHASAQTNGTSTASATLKGTGALSAVSNGTSTDAGILRGVGALSAQTNGTSADAGILFGRAGLVGEIDGVALLGGVLGGWADLQGEVLSYATVTGELSYLSVPGAAFGRTWGTSVVTGDIEGIKVVGELITGNSTITASMSGNSTMSTAISDESTIAASITGNSLIK